MMKRLPVSRSPSRNTDKGNMATLLIIDDSKKIREQIKEALTLTSIFDDVLEANNGIEGFKLLIDNKVDLVICDVVMPSIDGFKFLTMTKSRQEYADLPIIMLTGEASMEKKIEGLEKGASDYLTKPFDGGELIARVKVQLKLKGLQDELKKSNVLLKDLSNTDSLTKLNNRRYIMEILESEFERGLRYESFLSILMIDLDHFKDINDKYGHQTGDRILSEIGDILNKVRRKSDYPGRYGGEEFIVVLPHSDQTGAKSLAERLRQKIEDHPFISPASDTIQLTVSIGTATYPAAGIHSAAELIKEADRALYQAKEAGRNKVVVSTGFEKAIEEGLKGQEISETKSEAEVEAEISKE
jgi:diguanylate cyclase (GGDEF)-like protein